MISLEKILKFRNEKEPLFSSWHYNGHTLYGALIWRGAQPVLQLLLEIDYGGDIDELEKSDPFLAATKPPNKVTFLGRHPKHGPISVCSSMRSAWSRSLKFETGRATYHIEFLPESIWLGAPLEEIDGSIEGATARDFRLAGFFGVPGLERVSPYGEEAKEKFEAFGSPKEIWLWNGPSEWLIPMGESGFSFGVNTSVTSGTSATIGYTLQSTVDLHVHSKEPATIAQFKEKIFGLEQIISHYSIESFSFLSEEFHTKDGRSAISGFASTRMSRLKVTSSLPCRPWASASAAPASEFGL